MELTWIGHSAFRLRSGEHVIITDPFPDTLGLSMPSTLSQASVVTVSNGHPNHSATALVGSDATVLDSPGEYGVAGQYYKGVRTPLGPPSAEQETQAWNTMFVIELEGVVVCHLGDLAAPLTPRQVEELSSPDLLLLPVGGHCTLSPEEAAELVNAVSPRIVVPMHYACPGVAVELESLAPFLRELGVKEPEAQAKLTLSKSGAPSESQVVRLQPAAASA